MADDDLDAAQRRKPGRPPSKPPPPDVERHGISETPDEPACCFECVYEVPMKFKDLFAQFKADGVRDIHIQCDRAGMSWYGWTSSGESRVYARVDGARVNWYYCEAPFTIGLSRAKVEVKFASIDKSFYKISFRMRRDDSGHLIIICKDPTVGKECRTTVVVDRFEPDPELYAVRDLFERGLERYPVAFTLPVKNFRKTVSDAFRLNVPTMSLCKHGNYPVEFRYGRVGIDQNRDVYNDPDLIALASTVAEGQSFSVEVGIDNMKTLASAVGAGAVRLYWAEGEDVLCWSQPDEFAEGGPAAAVRVGVATRTL